MPKDHRKQWVFMGAAFLVALGLAVAVLAGSGIDPEGIRRALRLIARFSFVLFWCAYAGGSLAALFGARFHAMARHGRDFGLSFAAAHSVHLLLVIWLYHLSPEPPFSTGNAVFFSIGMLWMYLLAVLSIQHLAQLLGTHWRTVRLIGIEYIMLAFQRDFLPGLLHHKRLLGYLPFAILGLTGTALRLGAWARKTQRDSTGGIFLPWRLRQ